jgi:Flp pilus assembly protein TadD
MKTLGLSFLFALLLVPSFFPAQSPAQTPARSASPSSAFGIILLDGKDRPLRHARVEFFLTETGEAVSSLTDDKGQFRFTQLSPATYRITITAPGCEKLQFTASINGKVGPMIFRLHKANSPATPRNSSTISLAELTMPDKAKRDFEQGTALLVKGDMQGSVAAFRRSIETAPDCFRSHHNLGLAFYRLGQWDDAAQEFQTSINLTNGGFAPSIFALSMILIHQGDVHHAETIIQNGLLMDPASSVGKYCLAAAQYVLGQFPEAERSANDALSRGSADVDAYVLLAHIHEHLQNPSAVISDVQNYLKLAPSGSLREDANTLLQRAQQNLTKLTASIQ